MRFYRGGEPVSRQRLPLVQREARRFNASMRRAQRARASLRQLGCSESTHRLWTRRLSSRSVMPAAEDCGTSRANKHSSKFPEITSRLLLACYEERKIRMIDIHACKGMEHAHVESFSGRRRDESKIPRPAEPVRSVKNAQRRTEHKCEQPTGSQGCRTPNEFAP